ncbi:phosphatases II [Stereum hirsutum FP-91666 SS1]|uniref:phosphatases II n=1 Tax=Stereum hirsutum (strain FP-91666) TaxID=721885 RepID=UPI000440F2F8|nr:phosphatases II [Stereum hirsutum FP-91666 SS1]EIM92398.1 phosphatases II [Stereum hirsutum FP-91666 SS1]
MRMSPPPNPVPTWLQKAHDNEHMTFALRTLAEREQTRVQARSSSIPRPLSRRITHIPSHTESHLTSHYSTATSYLPQNKPFNRYADVAPYERTRVIVDDRYFNGNWVRENAGGHWAIATQAPLPTTTHEFLSILADAVVTPPDPTYPGPVRIRTVVQLTQNIESGMQKAHTYFPSNPGESYVVHSRIDNTLPPLKVTLLKAESIDSARCLLSTVSVAPVSSNSPHESVIFNHLLYLAWPDHGVPNVEDRAGLLNFIRLVDQTNKQPSGHPDQPETEPPIMVNCSAGIGRTGSFIALCSLLRSYNILSTSKSTPVESSMPPPPLPQSPLGPLPESLQWDQVAQEIDHLREQRPGMVQRPEQALLIYELLIAAFNP